MKLARLSQGGIIVIKLFCLATVLTILQTLFAMVMTEKSTFVHMYNALCSWDAIWYFRIVAQGYFYFPTITTIYTTNVVFEPAFPLLAWIIKSLLKISALTAVLLASQIGMLMFWTYFLLLLKRWKTPACFCAAGILCILCYPAAFYLISGYTDSLFLAMLFGMFFWLEKNSPYSWLIVGIHGCVMTATRFIGVPMIIVPLLYAFSMKGFQGLRSFKPWASTLLSSIGFFSFLLFNQLKFDNWKLPFDAHRLWHTIPNYTAVFNKYYYTIYPHYKIFGTLHPDYLSTMSFLTLLVFLVSSFFLFTLCLPRKITRKERMAFVLYSAAGICWYFTLSARWFNVSGGVRYMMPVYILILTALLLWSGTSKNKTVPGLILCTLLGILFFTIPMQAIYIWMYSHAIWVA